MAYIWTELNRTELLILNQFQADIAWQINEKE